MRVVSNFISAIYACLLKSVIPFRYFIPFMAFYCRDAVGGVVYAALKGDEDAMIKMVRGKSL